MLEKVQAMLADALNLPLSKVTPDAKIVEDLGADSLDVVELLSRLEDEYGVVIPDDDVENLKTVADVAAELEKINRSRRYSGAISLSFGQKRGIFVCHKRHDMV